MVESIVDPGEMRAAADDMVRVLITLRDNLNREDGIFSEAHGKIPFGQNNPSEHVHNLRMQAQEALHRAQANLVVQAGMVKKVIDSLFISIGEYEGIDTSVDEQLKRLNALLTEIQEQTNEAT